MQHIDKLKQMSACKIAIDWAGKYHSLQECREKCERGDWLLWFAGNIGIDRKILVLAACDCAERSLKHVTKGDDRPKIAIETARKWAGGDESVTIEDVRHAADAADAAHAAARAADAADAAHAAARAADAADAAHAAYAAAHAADAADAAARAAYAAAHAAHAAAHAAHAADAARAAYADELKWSANKVRERISWTMILERMEA